MTQPLPEPVAAVLRQLLDAHEQVDRQNVVRVRITQQKHRSYFSDEDATPRHSTNATLSRLAAAGALRLHWRKWEEGNWLEAVDLIPERADLLYTLLGRRPRAVLDQELRLLLDAQHPRQGWHASFLEWAHRQIDAHRSIAPLERDNPAHNVDLLVALDGLAGLAEPTLERTLSVRLFADSKRLDTLRADLLRVLRAHDPEAHGFGDDDRALLRAHQLDRVPEYLPLAGPLVLRTPNALLDLAPFRPSVALSAATLRAATIEQCTARWIVTIENPTSFTELLKQCPPDLLMISIGGFASPTAVGLLRNIRATYPNTPLLHWGDLDAGGLRILAHLRRQLGPVAALAMDPTVLASQPAHARPLTASDYDALAALRQQADLADCLPLIEALLAAGQKLEQEAVDLRVVLAQLAAAGEET